MPHSIFLTQTDDLKRQILSALADPDCNGNIYLVGGSAGGSLALWCALDPASTVSGWGETARSHIKAVVSLSGPSLFCDWSNPGGIPDDGLSDFEHDLQNYVHMPYSLQPCDPACDFGVVNCPLDPASPAWLVTHGATSNPPAFMLYATDGDPVPNSQAFDMFQALTNHYGAGFDVHKWTMHYDYDTQFDHAFKYWGAKNNVTGSDGLCVHLEVINFLTTH
jgi:pimeloyl-ACP methyl ester carboxylesterase